MAWYARHLLDTTCGCIVACGLLLHNILGSTTLASYDPRLFFSTLNNMSTYLCVLLVCFVTWTASRPRLSHQSVGGCLYRSRPNIITIDNLLLLRNVVVSNIISSRATMNYYHIQLQANIPFVSSIIVCSSVARNLAWGGDAMHILVVPVVTCMRSALGVERRSSCETRNQLGHLEHEPEDLHGYLRYLPP